jgi:CubicO group peptidase (beta-lactamase class C family)
MLGLLSTTCRVPKDFAAATSQSDEEEDARGVGVEPAAIDGIWHAVERLYASGTHPAIQLCLRRHGKVLIDRAIGHAQGNGPGDPPSAEKILATTETPFNIYSASKAVTAMVVHLLDQRHVIHLDDTIGHYVPEYCRHGKERITIRQVLTHRAGVPNLPREAIDLDRLNDRDWVLRLLCDAVPLWRPGRMLGYHAITGGFILGEVVQRVTGKDIRTVLREGILEPLGFRWGNYGVAQQDVAKVALAYVTGPPVLPPLSTILNRALGVTLEEAVKLSNDPRFMTAIVPAGNVITTANELSRFYQLLLDGGTLDGIEIFEPRTVARATAEQSYLEFDLTLGLPLRYGMGFMLGAKTLSLYGPDTEHVFGHLGFTNVVGWADPERKIAAGLMTSGKPVLYPQIYYVFDILRRIGQACPKVTSTLLQ